MKAIAGQPQRRPPARRRGASSSESGVSHDQCVCTWLSGGLAPGGIAVDSPPPSPGAARGWPVLSPGAAYCRRHEHRRAAVRDRPPRRWPVLRELTGRPDAEFREGQDAAVVGAGRALAAGPGRAAHRLGQVGGLLRLHRAAPPPRRGPDAAGQPAARADARPGGRRRPRRHPRGRDLQRQHDRVGRHRRPAGRRRRRRPAGLARAADQPALPRGAAARAGRPLRPGRRRRGALRLRLGARLPPRLPPHPRPARHAARRHAGAGDDRDGQRAGGRRRRRAAGRRRRRGDDGARAALPRLAAARACCGCRRTAPAWPGWPSHIGDLPGSGIVYTLTVAAAEETAALLRDAGHEVRAYTGRLDDADRKDAEEALREQRGQGAGRDVRAGHGLRQARPRLRRPPRGAVVAGQLLPAGGPCRPRRRARRRPAAARARRTSRSGSGSRRRPCRGRTTPPRC